MTELPAEAESLDRRWRTLVVAAVALAFPAGQTGFQLGAHGQIFFDVRFSSWVTVTTTLIVLAVLPRRHLPVPRRNLWLLAVPSLWMLGRFVLGASRPGEVVHPLLFVLGLASYAFCVPYTIYLIIRIANPDLPELRGARAKLSLAAIAVGFFLAGYGVGTRNDLFLTCEEFRVSGSKLPANCQPGPDGGEPDPP